MYIYVRYDRDLIRILIVECNPQYPPPTSFLCCSTECCFSLATATVSILCSMTYMCACNGKDGRDREMLFVQHMYFHFSIYMYTCIALFFMHNVSTMHGQIHSNYTCIWPLTVSTSAYLTMTHIYALYIVSVCNKLTSSCIYLFIHSLSLSLSLSHTHTHTHTYTHQTESLNEISSDRTKGTSSQHRPVDKRP